MALDQRQQTRLQYLQKNRPNDPQVKQLQAQGGGTIPLPKVGTVPNTHKEQKQLGKQIGKANFGNANSVEQTQQQANSTNYDVNKVGNNPDQSTQFGSQEVTWDENGQPHVNSQLTGQNKLLYDAEAGADTTGANLSKGLLGSIPQNYNLSSVNGSNPIPTDTMADRQKYQDAAYGELTHGVDDQYAKDKEGLAQNLADRGIPIGSAAYVAQQKQLDDRYDQTKLSARNQAYQAGGNEQEQSFGRQLQGHQTATGDYTSQFANPAGLASGLLGMGQGYQGPGTQGFQPVNQQGMDFSSILANILQNNLGNKEIGIKQGALNLARQQAGNANNPGYTP